MTAKAPRTSGYATAGVAANVPVVVWHQGNGPRLHENGVSPGVLLGYDARFRGNWLLGTAVWTTCWGTHSSELAGEERWLWAATVAPGLDLAVGTSARMILATPVGIALARTTPFTGRRVYREEMDLGVGPAYGAELRFHTRRPGRGGFFGAGFRQHRFDIDVDLIPKQSGEPTLHETREYWVTNLFLLGGFSYGVD